MDIKTAPHGATRYTLGVYDATGRYLGPAPVVIQWWPNDPRDIHARQTAEAVAA